MAKFEGDLRVEGTSEVIGNFGVAGDVKVRGTSEVFGNFGVTGDVRVGNNLIIRDPVTGEDVNVGELLRFLRDKP